MSFLFPLMLLSSAGNSQVGISAGNCAPDPSAGLDVNFSNKGLLPPRVALSGLTIPAPVVSPAVGLIVFNTVNAGTAPDNVTVGYYFWDGTRWIPMVMPPGTSTGDMLYWNGSRWIPVPAGTQGQPLIFCNGAPTWGGCAPVVITDPVSNLMVSSVTCGGNVTWEAGTPVTARGVCWSTATNPTVADSHTSDGSGPGAFVSTITGLTTGARYYVRAYAVNTAGTSYGPEVTFFNLTIGSWYQGGFVFYLDETEEHGLVAALHDFQLLAWVPVLIPWGCDTTLLGVTGTGIGTGAANTEFIASHCGDSTAARLCYDWVSDDCYDDWYLPSRDELSELNSHLSIFPGISIGWHWSSSECSQTNAYGIDILYSGVMPMTKSVPGGAWPIRSF